MARRTAKKQTPEESLLQEAKERFKYALDAWGDNRKAWLEDVKFAAGDQWPQEIKSSRQIPGKERPCLTVDKLGQYVRQVVNDGRQNRPGIKVLPTNSGHVEVAEAYEGLIRNIWNRSKGDHAADTALEHAVKGGFGFMRLATEYSAAGAFEQEVCVKRIRNPLCVVLDPDIQEADGSDARYGFVIDELPKDEFKAKYPEAKATDWEYDRPKYGDDWLPGGKVRVVEYFRKVEVPEVVHLLQDGTTVCDDDYQRTLQENPSAAIPIEQTRKIPYEEVRWARLTGAEILEENDWLGCYIPLIPVFGNEEDIDGKVVYSGLIRKAKDAQRLYNFSRSAFAERVALAPKAPFVGVSEAVEDYLDDWEEANTANASMLRYKGFRDDGTTIPAPQRQAASDVPAGFAQDAQMAEHDIQSSMGMYQASIGAPSNEKSGRAIMARQREGDVSTFHYQDNQARAFNYLGRQLVDLIPKVWDSKRVIRLLAEDGKAKAAMVDPEQNAPVAQGADPNLGALTIYNLGAGEYDVTVATGPSYTTKRQEAVDAMTELTKSAPQFLQVAGDIFVRNMDWPGAQEIADRLYKMLPPQLQESEQGDMPPEVQRAIAQVQQAQQAVQEQHTQLQQFAQQLAQEKAMTDAQKVKLESLSKELDAKDKILQANYQELSAKLELQATKLATAVPPQMPPGKDEPAIDPEAPPPKPINPQPPTGGFFTPEVPQ